MKILAAMVVFFITAHILVGACMRKDQDRGKVHEWTVDPFVLLAVAAMYMPIIAFILSLVALGLAIASCVMGK